MADMEDFNVNEDLHPVKRWIKALTNLRNEGLRLFNTIACSALSCFGVSAISVSPSFRSMNSRLQVLAMFALTLYVAFTAVVTFGTWTTRRVLNTATEPNRALIAASTVVTLWFFVVLGSVKFFAGEYALVLGGSMIVIQIQMLLRQQGFNIRGRNIGIGLFSVGAMVIMHESNTLKIVAIVAIILAGLFYTSM